MKNKAVTAIIIIFFLLPFIPGLFALLLTANEDANLLPNDYARITDVEYKAVVVDEPESRGKVVITERLTFDIHAASKSNLFWELWRDLPEDMIDGLKVDFKVNSVKQIFKDGSELVYDESPRLYWDDYDYVNTNPTYGPGKWYHSKGPYDEDMRRYECVFFYVDGLYREEVVFEIEYEMYNAALKYNDCSDLYLALYSGDTIKYLESYKAEILFPNEDMPSKGNYNVYTYGTNSNDFPVKESATANPGYYTFSIDLDKNDLKFKPYNEYIEFDLVSYGDDKHIFTEYAPDNFYTSDDVLDEIFEEQEAYAAKPKMFKTVKKIVFGILTALAICILIYAFRLKARMNSKFIFYKASTDYDFYRDIPSDLDPNFASALIFSKSKPQKDDSGIYSAILLSLARKEYIELREYPNQDVEILIKYVPIEPTPDSFPLFNNNIGFDSSFILDNKINHEAVNTNAAINNNATINTNAKEDITLNNTTANINIKDFTNIDGSINISDFTNALDSISTNDSANTDESVVQIQAKEYEPLTTCEEYYFNLIVRHATNNSIMMNIFQQRISSDYQNTNTFVRNINKSVVDIGIKEGYFQKADYQQPRKKILSSSKTLLIFGIIFITLVNIISYQTRMDLAFGSYFIFGICCIVSSMYLKSQANKYILLTQYGEDEYSKWRGLYNFLNSDTLIKERTFIELPLWEKYLVYATAFGISEKVIKAISIRCPEVEESPILSNNYCRSRRFHHTGRRFRTAVHHGSSGSHSGGGGFGYGGGGRGGGGGGGGH